MKLIVVGLCLLIPFMALSEEISVEQDLPTADVLQNQLNIMMQGTASWLDAIGNDSDSDKASANGYLQLSWLPRTADLGDIDVNFKVSLHLPQWNERFSLVIDNDGDEDDLLLDYESNHINDEQDGVNVALQYIKQFNQKWQVKNRVGFSRSQVYLRSEMQFDWVVQQIDLSLQPRLNYFLQDGWEPSIKTVAAYPLEKSYLSLSASWQQIQTESNTRRKIGFYHIKPTGENQLLVSGVQYNKRNDADDITNESYFISIRYRNLMYKSWMYFEAEPFVEFNQENDFRTEVGIVLSLMSYYGR